jgi:hypothetical protein
VRRIVEAHESSSTGQSRPQLKDRGHNYDSVRTLVAGRVKNSSGRISAKRLLPAARAAGYTGSARNFRRLVADAKAQWRQRHHRGDPGLGLLMRDGDVDMHAVTLRARDIHSLELKARASTRRVEQVIIADLAVTERARHNGSTSAMTSASIVTWMCWTAVGSATMPRA